MVAKEFTLDFSTAKTYVDSLNVIRSAIGTPLQTISSGGTSLLMIDSGTGDNLFAVDVRGIDPEEGRFNNLRLIVERNNLYVTGFVNRTNNVFYRFADFSHVTFRAQQRLHCLVTVAIPRYSVLQGSVVRGCR